MKLATIRVPGGTRAVRVDDAQAVETGHTDVVELLDNPDWRRVARDAAGVSHPVTSLDYAPTVPRPEKIICVGLNYRSHILEMGRSLPKHPTLFAKYHRALIGAYDDITLPAAATQMDWEAELGVVVGTPMRHATREQARAGIAGYVVVNDITARDWQYRTPQWLQGKTFEATTPVGPWLVTDDGVGDPTFRLTCEVDGKQVQAASTADLVFDPADLLAYISSIISLTPGDLIATGTPGGVGHARTPPTYLTDGALVVTRIEAVGECANHCVLENAEPVTSSAR